MCLELEPELPVGASQLVNPQYRPLPEFVFIVWMGIVSKAECVKSLLQL